MLYPKRIPRDDFERSLFERLLESTFDEWYHLSMPLAVGVSYDDVTDGEYPIAITNPNHPFDMMTFLDQPVFRGSAWIIEDGNGRARVWISLPAQNGWRMSYANYGDEPPAINWWAANEARHGRP